MGGFAVFGRALALGVAAFVSPLVLFALTGWSLLGGLSIRQLSLTAFAVFVMAIGFQVYWKMRHGKTPKPTES
ncbi:MAG: hypothetical protein WC876_05450 [Candidatus Thermoplasmatota archaeon]|jgi:hypothetical protein